MLVLAPLFVYTQVSMVTFLTASQMLDEHRFMREESGYSAKELLYVVE